MQLDRGCGGGNILKLLGYWANCFLEMRTTSVDSCIAVRRNFFKSDIELRFGSADLS